MAILKNSVSQQRIVLRACHLFGRHLSLSNTFLDDPHVSHFHASIHWDGEKWDLLDNSRNGTLLDGAILIRGTRVPLQRGNKIQFGRGENSTWHVEDLGPPRNTLLPQDDGPVIELERFHLLPNDVSPEGSIYLSEKGQWVWEDHDKVTLLNDGDIVHAGQRSWKFQYSPETESTLTNELAACNRFGFKTSAFHFYISQDEEHVSIKIMNAGTTLDLGERAHHYLLATLARKRLDDANRGFDPASQGWIDTERLSRMLGFDASHLNIQIFRMRSQLAKVLPTEIPPPDVIERRRGEVRFASFKFQIVHGSSLEGEFSPADLLQNCLPRSESPA